MSVVHAVNAVYFYRFGSKNAVEDMGYQTLANSAPDR